MVIRLILSDDHPIFRDGLVHSIEETGAFEVVGVGASADEAVELAQRFAPDIALLDLSMPGGGISAAQRISAQRTSKYIAILTVSENDRDVTAALQAGANGYILKGVSAKDLRDILSRIAQGEAYVSPALAAQMLKLIQTKKSAEKSPIEQLTKREENILRGVSLGHSNKEIGRTLGIQEKTVKRYMTAILEKLQARNRVEAALIAQKAWEKK